MRGHRARPFVKKEEAARPFDKKKKKLNIDELCGSRADLSNEYLMAAIGADADDIRPFRRIQLIR